MRTCAELAEALHEMAGWLGLEQVVVEPRGNGAAGLAPQL
jgi:uncharacterized protein YcaQ